MDRCSTVLLLLGLLGQRVHSATVLPAIPMIGEKASELEYVFWAGSAR